MWVQQRNFFGQTIAQPFANNGELVWNALDNLGGSNDLISIRGRAAYSRPFERVEALRRTADAQFRSTEQQLEAQLQQTEEQLNKLQTAQPGGDAILSPEAAQAIDRFQAEKLRIRKELRSTKAQLEQDIKSLGMRMKLVNVLIDAAHRHRARPARRVVAQAPAARDRHAAQRRCGMNQKRFGDPRPATAVVLLARRRLDLDAPREPASRPGWRQRVRGPQAGARRNRGNPPVEGRRQPHHAAARAPTAGPSSNANTRPTRARVRELAMSLANLKVVERKTSDPANYAKLGVEAPDTPTAASTLVEVVAGKKTWSLIVGKGARAAAPSTCANPPRRRVCWRSRSWPPIRTRSAGSTA